MFTLEQMNLLLKHFCWALMVLHVGDNPTIEKVIKYRKIIYVWTKDQNKSHLTIQFTGGYYMTLKSYSKSYVKEN